MCVGRYACMYVCMQQPVYTPKMASTKAHETPHTWVMLAEVCALKLKKSEAKESGRPPCRCFLM